MRNNKKKKILKKLVQSRSNRPLSLRLAVGHAYQQTSCRTFRFLYVRDVIDRTVSFHTDELDAD